jgi:uncharacterized membrane protein
MSDSDRIVADYLDRLDAALTGIPRTGRQEVLDDIETHIAEARAELAPDDEAAVRNLLERLGDPSEIAAEARERFGVRRPRTTWREIGALILLPFGGLVIPFVGWFVGVVLLWVSDAWTARDKLIGTLVVPGGLILPGWLLVQVGTGSSVCGGPAEGPTVCTGGGGSTIWPNVIFALLIAAPLVVDGYLVWRLRSGGGPS